tara:strand:- start:275 stop:688 length:414 start_codon:yes stop_codon:yes gene_type:complete
MSSKLLKSELKAIVKECLVEILSEGISTTGQRQKSQPQQASRRRAAFDHVSWAKETERAAPKAPDSREVANSLTSDPILAEVLADSQRTMVEQMQAESRGPVASSGDFAQRKVLNSDPMDLFSESSSNWAALAFDGK